MGIQLSKLCIDLVGKAAAHKTPCSCAVLKRSVHPQMREHLEEVRLSASKEAAYPRRVLAWRAKVCQKPVEDSLKSIARITHGEYFYAGTAEDLKKVYQTLNTRLVMERKDIEVTALFAAAAAGLALLSAVLSLVWFNRIL